jgi:hypothetical protein
MSLVHVENIGSQTVINAAFAGFFRFYLFILIRLHCMALPYSYYGGSFHSWSTDHSTVLKK